MLILLVLLYLSYDEVTYNKWKVNIVCTLWNILAGPDRYPTVDVALLLLVLLLLLFLLDSCNIRLLILLLEVLFHNLSFQVYKISCRRDNMKTPAEEDERGPIILPGIGFLLSED